MFHRRTEPIEHTFRYRIFMPLVDLDELPALFERTRLWSADRRAPARFRRSDYLRGHGDALPLAEAARDLVAERTGSRPAGPVRMLANPRYWGVGFNPVSFYFLDGADGAVEAMIAEVTSTPWKERLSYVLSADADGVRGDFEKRMHVSPFMPMEQRYEWSASRSRRAAHRDDPQPRAGPDRLRGRARPAAARDDARLHCGRYCSAIRP